MMGQGFGDAVGALVVKRLIRVGAIIAAVCGVVGFAVGRLL